MLNRRTFVGGLAALLTLPSYKCTVANTRIFYATQKAGITPLGLTTYATLRGLQTLGMTTTFNLE